MSNEISQMAVFVQQMLLLELIEDLLQAASQGDIDPVSIFSAIKALGSCAKSQFEDSSFRQAWESLATSLIEAKEANDKEAVAQYLARLDELSSQV